MESNGEHTLVPEVLTDKLWKDNGFFEMENREDYDAAEFYVFAWRGKNLRVYTSTPEHVYVWDGSQYAGIPCYYVYIDTKDKESDNKEWITIWLEDLIQEDETKVLLFGEQRKEGKKVLLVAGTFYSALLPKK